MTRAGYPYLLKEKARGKVFWYVRVWPGPRHRLRAEPGTPEFHAEYEAALSLARRGEKPKAPATGKAVSGTLNWLWKVYTASSAWTPLADATKRQRENIMKHVLKGAGDQPLAKLTKAKVIEGVEKRHKTPSQANNFLNTMRALFQWAKKCDHVSVDPTEGVETVARPKGQGFPAWTADDEKAFIARWPLGTRQYLAYMLHATTGLRRGDAVRVMRSHFREDGKIHLTAEKNGAELHIPVHELLVEAILACPPTGLFILETTRGGPWVKESYGNTFHEWAKEAGVVKNSHGVRKLHATRTCDAGASGHEMMALFGWKTLSMAEVYTKGRDLDRLAAQAGAKTGAVGAVVPLFAKKA